MNNKKNKIALTISIITLFVITLSFSQIIYADDTTPKYGGTLIVQIANDPTVLLTFFSGSFDMTELVSRQLFSGLFRTGEDYSIVPDLCKTWDVSEDGLTYTFRIHENVTFHDGVPLTSADIKWSYDYHFNNLDLQPQWYNVESITTPDDYTVVFKLKEVNVNFMGLMRANYMFTLPKHLYEGYEDAEDFANNPYNENPIGSGPFKFVEWVKEDHVTMVANDDYFKGRPYLDELIFKVIPNHATAVAALEAGEVDSLQTSSSPYEVERLADNPDIKPVTFPSGTFWGIEFNLHDPILSDLKVRQAIAYAIDNYQIVELAFAGGTIPSGDASYLSYLFADWRSPNAAVYDYDPIIAETLLDEAGYNRDTSGTRFTLTLDYCPYMEGDEDMWLMVEQYLHDVGIDLIMNKMDWATYFAKWRQMQSGEYDFQLNWCWGCCSVESLERAFYSQGEINCGYYNNSRVDWLVEESRVTVDDELRKEYLMEIQDITSRELPRFPIYNLVSTQLWSSEFEGQEKVIRYPFNMVWWTLGESVSPSAATDTISNVETQLNDLKDQGWNIEAALVKLNEAKTALGEGKYASATSLANAALELAEEPPNYTIYYVAGAAIVVLAIAVWYTKFRK